MEYIIIAVASVKQKSLSNEDKYNIKQAILKNIERNTNYPPDELAQLACEAASFVNDFES